MYADTINRIRSSYQQDLDDLRGLLDGDLGYALDQTRRARQALRLLTDLDGPQEIEVGSSITAAERTLTTARQALASGGRQQPPSSVRTSWVQQFYVDVLIDQGHIPSATPLAQPSTCIGCTAATTTNRAWPCPVVLAAPAGIVDAITTAVHRSISA